MDIEYFSLINHKNNLEIKGVVRVYSDSSVPFYFVRSYFLIRTTAAPRAANTARTGAGEAGVSGSSTGSLTGSSS